MLKYLYRLGLMSQLITPETDPVPAGYAEFIADLKDRVRTTQQRLEETFSETVVVWPGVEGLPEDEIARVES
ncbi:hypothetical protein GCM10027063_35050 [Promicromonospora xylanilytica]